MNRLKKAQQIARRLRQAGQADSARRLIEAFKLDSDFGSQERSLDEDMSIADIDDDELEQSASNLARFIPASASIPELEDEQPLPVGVEVPRRRLGRRR